MSKLTPLFGKLAHLKGVVEHLIVIGLIALGSFLATTMVPDSTALQYSLTIHNVAGTSAAHLRLNNTTKRAITVNVNPPVGKLLSFNTSIPNTNAPVLSDRWVGLLTPQQQVEALIVVEGDFPTSLVSKLVRANFKVVDDSTGVVTERPADLSEASVLSVSRSVRYGIWFLAPFLVGGLMFLVWIWYRSRPKALNTATPDVTQ